MADPSTINWFAVIVSAAVYFAFGALWYGMLFGKTWSAGMGFEGEEMRSNPADFVVTFVAELGLAIALAALLAYAEVTSLGPALQAAVMLWLGLVATTATVNASWDNRPWSVFTINVAHHLVGMMVVAAIVTLWPW